ncbi:uncharacterized protein NPIL_602351 [Nephila pilipes]|uniref:Uncharacterized protein n=1 Tax=Nephila pilipes TaxID=299642 RepID=A0A8X6PM47_NEPPI|nr:uncharacterized protein NPIL_602351 [Nephila pilipes]
MDRWLGKESLKKTNVVSSNAEIAESKDMAILESTFVQLQTHLPILPSYNFGQVVSTKRRYMILVTCRLDLLVLVTGYSRCGLFALQQNIGKQLLSTNKTTEAFGKKITQQIKAKIFLSVKENLKAIIKAGVLWGKKFETVNQKITEASYKVSYRITLAG